MEEELDGIAVGGWEKSLDGGILHRLKNCAEDMNEWGRKLQSKYRVSIDECRKELERLRGSVQASQIARYKEVHI